jgi:16S rRNA (adenine1518-N6/adenine1519-N6)-dimethyltransferase
VDGSVLRHILTAAELSPDDVVIEVGPGLGVLTRSLAEHAGMVLAVEKDENLARILAEAMASYGNVSIVSGDILDMDPQALLRQYRDTTGYHPGPIPSRPRVSPLPLPSPLIPLPRGEGKEEGDLQGEGKGEEVPGDGEPSGYKVVANLPYYVASPVLRLFLEASAKPFIMVVMVQKEVARQITAKPGEMSLLSVGVQLYGEPRVVKYVPARAFYPAPDVDSAVLKITVYPKPAAEVDSQGFFRVVRAGFSAARKQLINSLAHGLELSKTEVSSLLEKAGIDSRRRAETLSIEEWECLWKEYAKGRGVQLNAPADHDQP